MTDGRLTEAADDCETSLNNQALVDDRHSNISRDKRQLRLCVLTYSVTFCEDGECLMPGGRASASEKAYKVRWTHNHPSHPSVARPSGGHVIFDQSQGNFFFYPSIRCAAARLLPSRPGEPHSIPDFRSWEPCRLTPLVGEFSRESPIFPGLTFRECSIPLRWLTSTNEIKLRDVKLQPYTNHGLDEPTITFVYRWDLRREDGRVHCEICAADISKHPAILRTRVAYTCRPPASGPPSTRRLWPPEYEESLNDYAINLSSLKMADFRHVLSVPQVCGIFTVFFLHLTLHGCTVADGDEIYDFKHGRIPRDLQNSPWPPEEDSICIRNRCGELCSRRSSVALCRNSVKATLPKHMEVYPAQGHLRCWMLDGLGNGLHVGSPGFREKSYAEAKTSISYVHTGSLPLAVGRMSFMRREYVTASTLENMVHSQDIGEANRVRFPAGLPLPPGSSHVKVVLDNATGRQLFLGELPFPPPLNSGAAPYSPHTSPSSALKASVLRAAQITPLHSSKGTKETFIAMVSRVVVSFSIRGKCWWRDLGGYNYNVIYATVSLYAGQLPLVMSGHAVTVFLLVQITCSQTIGARCTVHKRMLANSSHPREPRHAVYTAFRHT
ncbi:hypothetical protein PR048_007744 [Dryococelus australis]|uniref:Uncharacterized protein n=1 Tax=Dryococelus australis TaxID=614101 RepID=A0ABQ9HV42_9NEOP|nr:hypothetical protein PR048_007744 [Dryococelus australis]